MKMMGLNGWLHWLAWFTKYFIFLVITMALAAVFFTVKFSERGRVLNQSSGSVIFVFFLLYSISSIMFCFCISVFFSKANIAAAAGGILWFMNYIPYFFIQQSYDTMGLGSKLASCLLSNVAMSLGAQLIGKFEGEGTGVQWSNLNHGPSIDDDLTLGYVFWMFAVDSVVYGLIAWYVEAVFPGDYGVPQPWYFPVLPSYWCGKSKEVRTIPFMYSQDYEVNFEFGSYTYSKVKKVKPLYGPKWPMGPVLNSGFLSMKRLGVLLLPPGWDASPSQGYPQHICWYPFVHLGEEKHCESKMSCLRTQHNTMTPARAQTRTT